MVRNSTQRVHNLTRNPEPWRTDAHVDKDRVFYSREFRRLSGVTQVIPPQSGYLFHDRLTHSLKVAQVAETLARRLAHKHPLVGPENAPIAGWVDPDYCYVAGLAHDIGHPPFGHAGEHQLQTIFERLPDRWAEQAAATRKMSEHEVEETRQGLAALSTRSFEGNAQSTRIVASLSARRESPPGLNLTLRSLAAIAKYPWQKGQHPAGVGKLEKKWNFYPEEASILGELEDEEFVRTERVDGVVNRVDRWIEAEIMDWADDITYAVHDAEDFFRAGMLPLHRVRTGLQDLPSSTDWMTSSFKDVRDDEIRSCFIYVAEKLSKSISFDGSRLTASLPGMWKLLQALAKKSSFPSGPFSGTHDANEKLQRFASLMIRLLSTATSVNYDGSSQRLNLRINPQGILIAEFFKALNDYFVIQTGALGAMQSGQANSLEQVFDTYCQMSRQMIQRISRDAKSRIRAVALNDLANLYRELPATLREYILANTSPGSIAKLQAAGGGVTVNITAATEFAVAVSVVDFLCGMRDSQLATLAAQLNGSREPGSMPVSWLDS